MNDTFGKDVSLSTYWPKATKGMAWEARGMDGLSAKAISVGSRGTQRLNDSCKLVPS
jgi:hypothetical protein